MRPGLLNRKFSPSLQRHVMPDIYWNFTRKLLIRLLSACDSFNYDHRAVASSQPGIAPCENWKTDAPLWRLISWNH
jgi:hypothetical protein